MSSILPLPWKEVMIESPASLRWAGLEGSPHLWKLGLREAGMLPGSALAFGISKAPLNPGPWSQGSWVRSQPRVGSVGSGLRVRWGTPSVPPGAYGFGLILHLAHPDSGAPPVSSTPDALAQGSPWGLVWFKESLFKQKCLKVFVVLSASPVRVRKPRIMASNCRRGSPSQTYPILLTVTRRPNGAGWVGTGNPSPPRSQRLTPTVSEPYCVQCFRQAEGG